MPTNFPGGLLSRGIPVEPGPLLLTTGDVFHVDSGHANASDSNTGKDSRRPLSTIGQAITNAAASNGDIILVAPGHAQTLTAAIAMSKAGVKLIGMGTGQNRPALTFGAIDAIDVTGADCEIHNIRFVTPTAAATGYINFGAARIKVVGCRFECGANLTTGAAITLTADGDEFKIYDCEFVVTADGPDQAISLEGAADNGEIRGCVFNGGSSTNVWDDAAIDAAANTPLNVLVTDCDFLYGTAFVGTGNWLRASAQNRFLRGAICKAGMPRTIYADSSGTTTGSGEAEDPTTLADAINQAVAGDLILLYPGTYTVTVALAIDVANLTIRPVHYTPGQRVSNVEIANDTDDVNTADITGAGCTIEGIHFTKGIANTTDGTELLDVDADKFTLRDCIIDMEARANADGVNLATGTKHHLIERCLFTDSATGKSIISSAASTEIIQHNHFDVSAGDAIIYDQIATPGAGGVIRYNSILSDAAAGGAAGNIVKLQATPGKIAIYQNYVFDSGADVDQFGDDVDGDALIMDNYRDGGAVGAGTAINPSVT